MLENIVNHLSDCIISRINFNVICSADPESSLSVLETTSPSLDLEVDQKPSIRYRNFFLKSNFYCKYLV